MENFCAVAHEIAHLKLVFGEESCCLADSEHGETISSNKIYHKGTAMSQKFFQKEMWATRKASFEAGGLLMERMGSTKKI